MRAHNDVRTAGGRQPHPGAQFGLYVKDSFPRGYQLLGQQVARAAGTFDGPGAIMRLVTGGCQQRGKYSQIPEVLTTCATLEGDRLRSVTSPPKAVLSK